MSTQDIPPIRKQSEVMDFLLSRRSRPARTLKPPVPDRATLRTILTAAARVPDHGKLEPWRFIVLERGVLDQLATLAAQRCNDLGYDAERTAKDGSQFAESHLAVAVVKVPRPTDKIPEHEQILSTGAVCISVLNAAAAMGFGANWLTGWLATDAQFCSAGLGLASGEWVAGFIHIGSETIVPPERPRPDTDAIISWATP